jgi:hypothetical protein
VPSYPRHSQVGEALAQSLRDEIEQMQDMQRKYQTQCDEQQSESEDLRNGQMMALDVKLHRLRQEARDAERALKLAIWAGPGGGPAPRGVGADTPLPPLPPAVPIVLNPALSRSGSPQREHPRGVKK